MCGIIGFSSKDKNYDLEKIKILLLCNSYERGGHGVGIFTPNTNIIKNSVDAQTFIVSDDWSNIKEDKILIGHARKSSIGSKTVQNTHPFEYNDVIGCHNGTLKQHYDLAKKYDIDFKDYWIDSHVLINGISKDLLKQTSDNKYLDIFNVYEGAAAVLYYSRKYDTMYVHRDSERPLYYGMFENSMYISSLEYALKLIDCTDIKQFDPNIIYKIKDGSIIGQIKSKIDSDYIKLANHKHIKEEFNYKKFKKVPVLSSPDFTGLYKHVVSFSPSYIVGYNLKYIGGNIKFHENYRDPETSASLTRDKFYFVKDYKLIYNNQTKQSVPYAKIIDDNDEEKLVIYSLLDLDNFIFVKGRYARLKVGLIDTETDERIAETNDYVLILEHTFNYQTCLVEFINGEKTYVNTEFLLPLSKSEFLEASKTFNPNESDDDDNEESQSSSFVDFQEALKKDILMLPAKKEITEDDVKEETDEDENNTSEENDEYISMSVVTEFTSLLSKELKDINKEEINVREFKNKLESVITTLDSCKNSEDLVKLTFF